MLSYVWPKDRPDLRARVAISLGFLASAKVSTDASLCWDSYYSPGVHTRSNYLFYHLRAFTLPVSGAYSIRNIILDFLTGYACHLHVCGWGDHEDDDQNFYFCCSH